MTAASRPQAGARIFLIESCLTKYTASAAHCLTLTMTLLHWTLQGAQQLVSILSAGDGSFWIADGADDAVRHFTP